MERGLIGVRDRTDVHTDHLAYAFEAAEMGRYRCQRYPLRSATTEAQQEPAGRASGYSVAATASGVMT